jgi:hypothetical protein
LLPLKIDQLVMPVPAVVFADAGITALAVYVTTVVALVADLMRAAAGGNAPMAANAESLDAGLSTVEPGGRPESGLDEQAATAIVQISAATRGVTPVLIENMGPPFSNVSDVCKDVFGS